MDRPKVSVVIPVYNMAQYLQRCIDSVIKQTLEEIEIILVNDGSTDSSGRLCDEIARSDDRIKVVHKENAGLGFARNSGIEIATGQYIAFLDSDDYVEPEMYGELYALAARDHADACIGGCLLVDQNGACLRDNKGSLEGLYRGDDVLSSVYLNVLGTLPSCPQDFLILWQSVNFSLYSLDFIRGHGLRFESERVFSSEDTLFNMKFFRKANCVRIISKAYYFYCENAQSLTQIYRPDRARQAGENYMEALRRVAAENFAPDFFAGAKLRLQRTYLGKIRGCLFKACRAFPSYFKSRSAILEVCRDPVLVEVLRTYPIVESPLKYRVFAWALKHRVAPLLYVMQKLKG